MSDSTLTTPAPRRGRSGVVVVAAAALVVLLLAGTGFAAWRLLGSSGSQPADVLPADTLGVVSLDLDPSGGQKIAAIRALRSFPSFREQVGLKEGDDPAQVLFEQLQSEEDLCPDVDYAKDVAPWVGQRFAVAAVPGGKDDAPQPVAVLQVEDADAARAGVEKLAACAEEAGGDSEEGGVAVGDDYLVLAETTKQAQAVLDAGAKDPLSGDEDYQRWTERAGGEGILTMYAAPGAGKAIDELTRDDALVPPEALGLQAQLEDFGGAAATLRFEGGGIVLSGAADTGAKTVTGGSVADQVGSLPADTAAVLAFGSSEDSRAQVREQLEAVEPGPTDDILGQIEGGFASVGLEFPDDLLTVLGDSISISVGGDAPASLTSPQDVPVGVRVDGDPEAVQDVITRAESGLGQSLDAQGVTVETDDDSVALSLQPDYAKALLGDGGLGDDGVFGEVVPELADAQALLFVRFDSAWRDLLLENLGEEDARGDLEALQALGLSAWNEDGAVRFEARLALD